MFPHQSPEPGAKPVGESWTHSVSPSQRSCCQAGLPCCSTLSRWHSLGPGEREMWQALVPSAVLNRARPLTVLQLLYSTSLLLQRPSIIFPALLCDPGNRPCAWHQHPCPPAPYWQEAGRRGMPRCPGAPPSPLRYLLRVLARTLPVLPSGAREDCPPPHRLRLSKWFL